MSPSRCNLPSSFAHRAQTPADVAPHARRPNWIRQSAWTLFGLAAWPSAIEARRTPLHRHHHKLEPRADALATNPYYRPWLLPGAKVVGDAPWLAGPDAPQASGLQARQTYDTSQVDWSSIDWSKVSFADVDWSSVDYSNSGATATTYTYTIVDGVTQTSQTAQPSLLQADPYGAVGNLAAPAATTSAQAAPSTPLTTAQPSLLQANQFGAGGNIAAPPAAPSTQAAIALPRTTLQTLTSTSASAVAAGNLVPASSQPPLVAPTTVTPLAMVSTTPTSVSAMAAPALMSADVATPLAPQRVVATQIGSGPNSVSVQNQGVQPNVFAFFANDGPFQPTFDGPYAQVTLSPGQSESVLLPQGWSGRLQKLSGTVSDPATWAEMTFNGGYDLTYFDVSYIRGYNGPVVMQAADGSAQSGSSVNFLATAPASIETTDSDGTTVLLPTEPYTGGVDGAVVAFLRGLVPSRAGYVQNGDNDSSLGTQDHNMVITFY